MNQVWNWVKGLGSRFERSREPTVNWGAWELFWSLDGATMVVSGEGWRVGGLTDQFGAVKRWVKSHVGEFCAE